MENRSKYNYEISQFVLKCQRIEYRCSYIEQMQLYRVDVVISSRCSYIEQMQLYRVDVVIQRIEQMQLHRVDVVTQSRCSYIEQMQLYRVDVVTQSRCSYIDWLKNEIIFLIYSVRLYVQYLATFVLIDLATMANQQVDRKRQTYIQAVNLVETD